jgi:hypothetical protein
VQIDSRGTSRPTFPFGEDVTVTLQVVLGGSDGILVGTDTKTTGFPTARSPLREADRRALETGKTRSGEYGTEKVLFNERRTIAVVCSGSDTTLRVGKAIVENLEAKWNEFSEPIETLCLEKWKSLGKNERREALEHGENTVILVHSGKPRVFKIRFGLDQLEPFSFHRSKTQKLVVFGGDSLNPSGFLLERYLPTRAPSISKLALLAAHYILVGGELNPAGVGGLAMYFSKESGPFQAMSEKVMEDLWERSAGLNRRFQRAFLKHVEF